MATKREELQITATATDKASAIITDIADKVDQLDGETAAVEVTAEDKATADVETLMSRIESLTDEQQLIVLKAEAAAAEREINKTIRLLAKVDGEKAEAVLDAKNSAEAKLDELNRQLTTLDERTVTPDVDMTSVTSQVDDLDRKLNGTDQSGSVFANFAGNAAQEMPGVAGAFGPLNMAISQFVEYGAEGNIKLKDLVKFAGAIAALGVTFSAVSNGAKLLAEEGEAAAKRVEDIRDAMDDGQVSATDYLEVLRTTEDAMRLPENVTVSWENFGEVLQEMLPLLGGGLDDIDVAAIFDKADISLSRFSRTVTGTTDDLAALEADLLAARDAGRITNEEWEAGLELVQRGYEDVRDAEREAAEEARAFAVDMDDANTVLGDVVKNADPLAQLGDAWAKLVADVADGNLTWDGAADAINAAAEALGITPEEVLARAYEEATDAIEDNAEAAEEAAEVHREQLTTALEGEKEALDELIASNDEWLGNQRSLLDLRRDQTKAAEKLADVQAEYAEAVEAEDVEAQAKAVEDYVDAALDAADATVELAEAEATRNGTTLTAVQRTDAFNRSMVTAASTASGPLRAAVLQQIRDYNQIPTEVMTQIEAAIDRGDIAEANRLIDEASETRTVSMQASVDQARLSLVNAQLNAVAGGKSVVFRGEPDFGKVWGAIASLKNQSISFRGNLKGRATGDPNWEGGPVVVGEDGVEVVDLPTGTKITPNHKLDTIGRSGDTINNYVTNNWPAGTSAADVAAAARRQARIQGPQY